MDKTRIQAILFLVLDVFLWAFLFIGYKKGIPPTWFFIVGTTIQVILGLSQIPLLVHGDKFKGEIHENETKETKW